MKEMEHGKTTACTPPERAYQAKRNDTRESQIDMVCLDRRLFIEYMNKLDSKERAIVTKTNGLKSYGFNDVFEQDGVGITLVCSSC